MPKAYNLDPVRQNVLLGALPTLLVKHHKASYHDIPVIDPVFSLPSDVQDVDKRASEACPGNSGSSKLSKADQDAYLNKHNELRSQKQLRELVSR